MGRTLVETIMGGVVLLVAIGFVVMAYDTAQVGTVAGYEVQASFYKIGGLNKGSDVRIAGIKVGTVIDNQLDPQTYDALVTMSIMSNVKLPVDTAAAVGSDSMLGGKFIRLEPGHSADRMEPGAMIENSKDYRSLEDQVGEIIFLATGGDNK